MPPRQFKKLTHHARGELFYRRACRDPLIVRAGKAPIHRPWPALSPSQEFGAKKLNFFATHDVVNTRSALTKNAGDNPNTALLGLSNSCSAIR